MFQVRQLSFGSLYETKSENDEIFVSDAPVQDVEIIDPNPDIKNTRHGAVVTATNTSSTLEYKAQSDYNKHTTPHQGTTLTPGSTSTPKSASNRVSGSPGSWSCGGSDPADPSGGGGSSGGGGGYGY